MAFGEASDGNTKQHWWCIFAMTISIVTNCERRKRYELLEHIHGSLGGFGQALISRRHGYFVCERNNCPWTVYGNASCEFAGSDGLSATGCVDIQAQLAANASTSAHVPCRCYQKRAVGPLYLGLQRAKGDITKVSTNHVCELELPNERNIVTAQNVSQ